MHLSREVGELPNGEEMRIFNRIVMPVAWLAVFAVIAVALVKIAFVDGMQTERFVVGPEADVAVPVVQAIVLGGRLVAHHLAESEPCAVEFGLRLFEFAPGSGKLVICRAKRLL